MSHARLTVGFVLACLLLAFSVHWRTREIQTDPVSLTAKIEHNIQQQLLELDRQAQAILTSIQNNAEWAPTDFVFGLYDSTGIVQWNSDEAVPDSRELSSDTLLVLSNGGGQYLVKHFPAAQTGLYLNGYILLQERYPIQNQYLSSTLNHKIFSKADVGINFNGAGSAIQIEDQTLFYVTLNSTTNKIYDLEWVGWFCLGVGLLFLGLVTISLSNRLINRNQSWVVVIVVFIMLLAVRMTMVYGHFPGPLKTWPIFDPAFFASSTFNDSIGNFFLNTVGFVIAGYIAYRFLNSLQFRGWARQNAGFRLISAVFFLLLCFGFHLLPFLYLETIFHNSNITVDISQQLYTDPVRLFAFGCVVLSSFTGFYFFNAFYRSAFGIVLRQMSLFLLALTLSAIAIFIYHLYTERVYEIPIAFTIVHLLILYFSSVTKKLKFLAGRKFSVYLLALVVFSFQASLGIRLLTEERQQKAMLRYGNSFLVERDVLGEYLLNQAAVAIGRDAFIQQQFTNPFNRQGSITQKVKRSHLNSYFDRYEIKVTLYDSKGTSLTNQTDPSLDSLRESLMSITQSDSSASYFVGRGTIQNNNQYVSIIPIQATVSGFVVLEATLRQVSPVTVFPKLLLDERYSHYTSAAQYSHALYRNGIVQHSAGNFKYELNDFNLELANPELFHAGIKAGGYYHIALEDLDGRVAVVSIKAYSFFNILTNFSFLFLLGLLVCFVGFILAGLPDIRIAALSYSGRIQFYVYAAMVLPLVVIGGTTLRLNSFSEHERLETENMEKANRLAQNMAQVFVQSPDNLQDELTTQTRTVGVDASVFSERGILAATNQPDIYTNQLVSRLLNPQVLQEIRKGNYLFTVDDSVGKLNFRNTYAAIRSPLTGELVAVLSVPYFESQQTIEQNQLKLASNIWTVFALVFLLFYLLSFVALNWLTKPLQIIATSLRRTTLSGSNRKLTWNSRDEIGTMVNEYNNLVDNLEKSKAELARKQREATWREMARQVAHEIKNPLTPIKLTLQQMEKSIREGTAQPEKNVQSVKTVLHHVDILNEIASSFSAFAQMPELQLERVKLQDIIQNTVSLYHNSREHVIDWDGVGEPVFVMADTKLFVRIFGNIILNAFQSGGESTVVVKVRIMVKDELATISFADNGKGMIPEVVDKVFIPYFSTKETGSGLGLAIAKQGIEQAGGRIWCESKPEVGSTFFISLPII